MADWEPGQKFPFKSYHGQFLCTFRVYLYAFRRGRERSHSMHSFIINLYGKRLSVTEGIEVHPKNKTVAIFGFIFADFSSLNSRTRPSQESCGKESCFFEDGSILYL